MRQNSTFFDTLAATPLFAGLDNAQISALLGEDIKPTSFPRGAVLFSPTDFTPSLAIVLRGSALVYRVGMDGHRVLMSRLMPGSVFGMASLFYEEGGFPTEIQAEKACGVLFLPKAWVEDAFARQPLLSRNYITLLSERIHFLNRRLDTLAGDDLPARLLRMLRSLSGEGANSKILRHKGISQEILTNEGANSEILRHKGISQEILTSEGANSEALRHKRISQEILAASVPAGEAFTLPFSLSQLAEMLGVGRATLYRALDTLEASNAISRDGKTITIMEERS